MPRGSFALPDSFAIPTMPVIASRVTTMLQNPKAGLGDVAQVLAQDAPLSAKVLKIANSSFYGVSERCLSTQQATTILGINVLRNVVLQATVIKQFEHLKNAGVDLDGIWRHSIVTAQTCSFLVQHAKKKLLLSPEEAYTCGLLHDLGEVVLIDNLKDAYVALWTRASSEGAPLVTVEAQAFGYTHCDVGGRVATRWGLPPAVVHAIALHHAADGGAEQDPAAALTSCANLLVEHLSAGDASKAAGLFTASFKKRLGIDPETEAAAIAFAAHALQTVEI